MENAKAISDRIEGRKCAAELIALMVPNETDSKEFKSGYWTELVRLIPEDHIPPKGLLVLTDEQAKWFESLKIRFGEHHGTEYGKVDIDYLTWLADASLKLQAYLRSDRGQQRIRESQS